MYGKIENGAVTLWHTGSKDGYYPIELTKRPTEEEPIGFYYESAWEQHEDKIVQIYELTAEQVTAEEIVNILTGETE